MRVYKKQYFNIRGCVASFISWLYLASLLFFSNMAKSLFFRFSSSQIFVNFFSKIYPRFLYWVLACSQKCEGFLILFTFIPGLQPNLAESSWGWSPVWLHHKIEKKTLDPLETGTYIEKGSVFFLFGKKICQNLTWFWPIIQRIIHRKKWHKFTRFQRKKNPNCKIFTISSSR